MFAILLYHQVKAIQEIKGLTYYSVDEFSAFKSFY